MDAEEDQINEPGSEDEEKEKETTQDSGEANAEENCEGMEIFSDISGQEHAGL